MPDGVDDDGSLSASEGWDGESQRELLLMAYRVVTQYSHSAGRKAFCDTMMHFFMRVTPLAITEKM